MSERTANYDRPIKARLYVRLENGDEWEVADADLEKFNLVSRTQAYRDLVRSLEQCGMQSSGHHSSLRYAIERSLYCGRPLDPNDHDPDDDNDGGYVERLGAFFHDTWVPGDEADDE